MNQDIGKKKASNGILLRGSSQLSKWVISMVIVLVPNSWGASPSKWPNSTAYKCG